MIGHQCIEILSIGLHCFGQKSQQIAGDNAIFGQNGPRIGSPADGYCVSYLTRVIRAKRAREMWMLCRRYTAQEALAMGLVNTVVPVDKVEEEVDKWCQEIMASCPTVIQMLKTGFDVEAHRSNVPLGTYQRLMAPEWYGCEEATEAQQAFMEKRPANFAKIMMKGKTKS